VARPTPVLAIAAPVGLGLWSLGLAFGLVVVHAGLAWWWATVFTAVVYAGSLEFLLVGLAVAGAPLLQVASTTLIVNLRHVFYALSFPRTASTAYQPRSTAPTR
jgi:predicted branched-subunit amino acid permease